MTFLINIHLKSLRIGFLVVWFFGLTACVQADPGTRADREASFDVIVAKIMAREAFSELLGIDVPTTLRLAEH